ncbi:MAG: hypothetical protein IT285_02640 [Bdellovibrionales bacterium]|nr:hypothetical protein [Bdellovibrionales bacterium]
MGTDLALGKGMYSTCLRWSSLVPFVVAFTVLHAGQVLAQPGGPCPIQGLTSRVDYSRCGQLTEVDDPAGHTGLREGEGMISTLGATSCRPERARIRQLEQGSCMAVGAGLATASRDTVTIPFSTLRLAGYEDLLPGVKLGEEGRVTLREDRASGRLVIDAEGQYTRDGAPAPVHRARIVLEVLLRPDTTALVAPVPSSSDGDGLDAGERLEGLTSAFASCVDGGVAD